MTLVLDVIEVENFLHRKFARPDDSIRGVGNVLFSQDFIFVRFVEHFAFYMHGK